MIEYCYSEDLPGIPFTSILLLPLVILIIKRSLRLFMYFSEKSKWSFYMFHRVSQSIYNIWLKIRCILNSFKHVRAIQGDEVLPTQTSGYCVWKIVALDLLESVFHGHLCDSWGFSFFLSSSSSSSSFFFFFWGGGGGEGYTIKLLKESFPSIKPIRTLSDPRSPKLGTSIEWPKN